MYRYVKCEVCGNGFVAGASSKESRTPLQGVGSGKGGLYARPQSNRKAPTASIPSRFAPAQRPENTPLSSKGKTRNVNRLALTLGAGIASLGVAIGIGYGGYLYWGEGPRLERGISYYEKGDHGKAFELLLPLAKKGHSRAKLLVGNCYSRGSGVMKDSVAAVEWYRAAADQGEAEAMHQMFLCCRDGIGIDRDPANAAKWCRKAAEAGWAEAMADMAMLYVEGEGVEANRKAVYKWYRRGAECGHAASMYQLGMCYKLELGVEKDEDEASKWQNKAVEIWRISANAGDSMAMLRLAELYYEGDVVEQDKEIAVSWFRKSAECGNHQAQFRLSNCYHEGEGVEKDNEESAKWLLKAAESGDKGAWQWVMGRYYQEGWGVEQSPTEAVKWFERAAKKGFSLAKYYLAMCYLEGDGVEKDLAKGEELLSEAAEDGEEEAKKTLAVIKNRRKEEAARIEREKEEKEEELRSLTTNEKDIALIKERINKVLNGEDKETFAGLDAETISKTDPAVSVSRESALKLWSTSLSMDSSLESISDAAEAAEKEVNRLIARVDELRRVKKLYDEKELESRKESCAACGASGEVACAVCKGTGTIVQKERESCPKCGDGGSSFNWNGQTRKGAIQKEIECSQCRGQGETRSKCGVCKGKRTRRYSQGGARLDTYGPCDACSGTGWAEPRCCTKCRGDGKIVVWQTCDRCQGRGEVTRGTKEECPTCAGKSKLKCNRCQGRGYYYRPK